MQTSIIFSQSFHTFSQHQSTQCCIMVFRGSVDSNFHIREGQEEIINRRLTQMNADKPLPQQTRKSL
jgi:hypothetical protein